MAKSQQDSGEERVTAKSRPMMNFIARTSSFVSASDQHYHEQFMESLSSTKVIQNWMTTMLGLLKSRKLKLRRMIDQDDRKTSWRMVRKVRPDHEILLDGTAQSVRNGETLRDRSGRLWQDLKISSWETKKQNWSCL